MRARGARLRGRVAKTPCGAVQSRRRYATPPTMLPRPALGVAAEEAAVAGVSGSLLAAQQLGADGGNSTHWWDECGSSVACQARAGALRQPAHVARAERGGGRAGRRRRQATQPRQHHLQLVPLRCAQEHTYATLAVAFGAVAVVAGVRVPRCS